MLRKRELLFATFPMRYQLKFVQFNFRLLRCMSTNFYQLEYSDATVRHPVKFIRLKLFEPQKNVKNLNNFFHTSNHTFHTSCLMQRESINPSFLVISAHICQLNDNHLLSLINRRAFLHVIQKYSYTRQVAAASSRCVCTSL